MADEPTTIKKTTRAKKLPLEENDFKTEPISKTTFIHTDLDLLIDHLTEAKFEVDKLDREVAQAKKDWLDEQKMHEQQLTDRAKLEEIDRKREKDTYEYEIQLARKKSQDEFEERKARWEKELDSQKAQIETERKELIELRKSVEKFPDEKDKAIKDVLTAQEKSLEDQFEQDKKFLTQSHKSEIDMQSLRIVSLESENSRHAKEIESLKKSLEEVSRKFEAVAVKAIESTRPEQKTSSSQS